jgi:hypothetical protein
MNKRMTVFQQATKLGYQATHTSRGVRLWKSGGEQVLFRNEAALKKYLDAVERFKEKQQELAL